jgi:RNA polymerase sigma-70 factor (ECF subfamily)
MGHTPHLRVVADQPLASEPRGATVDARPDNERALVERAKLGDKGAWGRLYQQHYDRLFDYALHLTGDARTAEDLTQEVFARSLVAVRRFRGDASFATWTNRIALNLARETYRRKKRRQRIAAALGRVANVFADRDPHQAHLDDVRTKVLYGVLDNLPPNLREVFILRDLMGLSVAQVAEELSISPSNVAVRCHRARARIRTELAELGWIEGGDE